MRSLAQPPSTHWLSLEKCVRAIAIRAQLTGALHSFTIENRMAAAKRAKARR